MDLRRACLQLVVAVMIGLGSAGMHQADAQGSRSDCVREFFRIARRDYGWSPHDVVVQLNTDSDRSFQLTGVHDLRMHVADGSQGIVNKQTGETFSCPAS
jgi:hypothetical protein